MPRQSSKTGSCDLRQSVAENEQLSVSDLLSLSPTAPPVFFRTYSRLKDNGNRESYQDTLERCQTGLAKLGKFTPEQKLLTYRMQRDLKSLPSGRWYWVGGTNWINKPENYAGAYNCTSQVIETLWDIVSLKDLSMCGSGVGWVIENVKHLPNIKRKINLTVQGEFGTAKSTEYSQLGLEVLDVRVDQAIEFALEDGHTTLYVGDSRQAWCMATYVVLRLFTDRSIYPELNLTIDFSHVRKPDSLIKGFGGKANPHDLVKFYQDIVNRLNKIFETATAGQFTPVDVAWLACRQLQTVVAGNIRRSAGMSQGASNDEAFKAAKLNLWQEDSEGNWKIDPERDALRMANFTTVYHYKPSLEEVTEAVKTQYYSSEGAIQFAPEAIARSNVDIFPTEEDRIKFIDAYCDNPTFGRGYLVHAFYEIYGDFPTTYETEHRMTRYGLNPCGEIIGRDFYCNLSEIHLNQLDPIRMSEQADAFKAGALTVGALLHHEFVDEKFRKSREVDPIVGVSFTGLFDFFVNAFGVDWLYWWKAGRPNEWYIPVESFKNNIGPIVEMFGLEDDPVLAPDLDNLEGLLYKKLEQTYLSFWKQIVDIQLTEYCDQHGLRKPNRFTTVQPAGTKSLLTGASPGWHPPKAARYIRRITFQKNHPVALAAIDYGYSILPAQSDKDENGNLLNDPFDPRCTEWLVEIPVEMPWASLPGADQIAIEQFSAVAQFDFYMQVQNHYTGHNTSATIELREDEISDLSVAIYKAIENNEGYISAALQARFDAPFPRLPFEKIDKETYDRLHQEVLDRRKDGTFYDHLMKHDKGWTSDEGPAACDGDKCLLPLAKPE
jgi:ribonucleotide reductase, class II